MNLDWMKGKARLLKRPMVIAAIILGIGCALVARVYPEVVAGRSTWGYIIDRYPEAGEWHYSRGRCSLADILRQGFEYHEMIPDAAEEHQRNPFWLALYIMYVPLFMAFSWTVLSGLTIAFRYLSRGLSRHSRSRLWRTLIILSAISVLTHLIYLRHLTVGGYGHLGPAGRFLHNAGEVLGYVLLPFTLTNYILLFAFPLVNLFLFRNTSPHIGFSGIRSWSRFMGAYDFNGWLWEGLCLLLLTAFWLLAVTLVTDGIQRILERRRVKGEDIPAEQ